ncbi:hypothetical protein SCUCBS95973_007441 [Sporothrix curviconia]|uniref:Uncharacterized protein n=1 Tax=Sporothrix curviconia TaxID=1260050 RepID=A0ABP0CG13_9PEZI
MQFRNILLFAITAAAAAISANSAGEGLAIRGEDDVHVGCTGDGNHCSISTASGGHVVCS